jgi:hypothetical protein
MKSVIPVERILRSILILRGERVIVDSDLASLYGVTTKALNQAVRRNIERFPDDFMFQLTVEEKTDVVTNCDHLAKLRYSSKLPHVFTEHGALMVANILKTKRAVNASIQVVRSFVHLRRMLSSNVELAKKLAELENKYDAQFKVVFDAIRQLMIPPEPRQKGIGFHVEKDEK